MSSRPEPGTGRELDNPGAQAAADGPVIEALGITKSFEDDLALDHVDLELARGEVHALLGENGAGKTTLSNVIAGIYRADSGVVRVDGVPQHFRSPAQAIEAGIGMVHQHFRLIHPMTVAENLHLGWRDTPEFVSKGQLVERSERVMDELGLHVDPEAEIWQLSVGEQQRVEILRTLARGARVLILDEPTAVLTAQEARELFEVIRTLVAGGRTVVFISHKLNEVLEVSDRITVLRNGRRVITRETLGATARELARLMTGEERDRQLESRGQVGDRPVLELEGITARGARGLVALRDVDVAVRNGEIVGIAGVSGNGQTELAEVSSGLRRVDAGRVVIDGVDLTSAAPRRFADAGVGYIPEDRLGVGLVGPAQVRDNAVLRHYRRPELSGKAALRRGSILDFAKKLVSSARVQTRSIHAPAGHLSGGNQQRLVAGREAMLADRVFIASQPTRGLDVNATQDVRESLLGRRGAGCAVLLISDDLDEILMLSDRVAVMYEGRIVGEFTREEADRETIGLLMGGHVAEAEPRGSIA
ncbi:MAG: ABC transporter ATP-binding protein [Actinomycetota bacterium]